MNKPFRERHSFLIVVTLFLLIGLYFFSSKEIFGIPLFVYIVLFGIDVLYVNVSGLKESISAKGWPISEAVLINGEAIYRNYSDNSKKWFLEIEYEYSASGKSFKNENYNWVRVASTSKEKIETILKGLRNEPTFPIRFNPESNDISVVSPIISIIPFIGIAVSLGVILVGFFGLLGYFEVFNFLEYIRS
jgi:hypothetical protein